MLEFLTPQVFEGLIWAVILIGGALAILRLVRDLGGPPRWPKDEETPVDPELGQHPEPPEEPHE